MRNSLKFRLLLIVLMLSIGLVTFFAIAEPVLCRDEHDRHSIVAHLLSRHSPASDIHLGLALSNTLFVLLPVAIAFLIIDLYVLRKTPVEHIGCFALFLVAIALNVIVGIGLWLRYGGWGPQAVAPIVIGILVAMLIPSTISEWRIFRSSPESDGNVG